MSPFFYGQAAEPAHEGHLTIDDSDFRTSIGVNVATEYVDQARGGMPTKTAVIRRSVFGPPDARAGAAVPVVAISMNEGMPPQDARPRTPVFVYDFNRQAGRNFEVYYSLGGAAGPAPCRETLPEIAGWVCSAR
jgi:hypothetical protein